MKKLQNLKGAKVLSKKEQQVLKGGLGEYCDGSFDSCPSGQDCWHNVCFLSPPGYDTP